MLGCSQFTPVQPAGLHPYTTVVNSGTAASKRWLRCLDLLRLRQGLPPAALGGPRQMLRCRKSEQSPAGGQGVSSLPRGWHRSSPFPQVCAVTRPLLIICATLMTRALIGASETMSPTQKTPRSRD